MYNLSPIGQSKRPQDDGADVIQGILLEHGIVANCDIWIADILNVHLSNFDTKTIDKTVSIMTNLGYRFTERIPGDYDGETIQLDFLPPLSKKELN